MAIKFNKSKYIPPEDNTGSEPEFDDKRTKFDITGVEGGEYDLEEFKRNSKRDDSVHPLVLGDISDDTGSIGFNKDKLGSYINDSDYKKYLLKDED